MSWLMKRRARPRRSRRSRQEIEGGGLDGDVEGGDGFVADEEVGAAGEGAGNGDALLLAAGELVGVAGGVGGGEADEVEEAGDLG